MAKTNLEKSKVEGPMPQKAPGEGSGEEINTWLTEQDKVQKQTGKYGQLSYWKSLI